jgi:excisionase family DNA binding protein
MAARHWGSGAPLEWLEVARMTNDEMTVTEVAARLGVSTVAVRALIRRGRLVARRVGPIFLIRESDLDAYRASVAHKARPGPPPRGGKTEAAA